MAQPLAKATIQPLAPAVAEAIEDDLIRDEGFVPHAYQDSLGFWTIGVGRLIDRRKGGKLSEEECRYLLANDIRRTAEDLDRELAWWRSLSPARQRVMLNMCFNLGITGLGKFKNTLAAIEAGRFEDASRGMLASKWAKQVGARATRLADLMRAGEPLNPS